MTWLLFLFLPLAPHAHAKSFEPPKVYLEYASSFDSTCESKVSYTIKPEWVKELKDRLPGLNKQWQAEGSALLSTAFEIVGKPFSKKELTASLSLCTFPSMSSPILINSRFALKSFTDDPISDSVLLSTVFHEILHGYIDGLKLDTSKLLKKYDKESVGVLNHLHLLALQKATYIKLKWEDKLKGVIAKDEELPNPDYKKAWSIVNKSESYQTFIEELKAAH
jgi:hypothetical protein